MNKISMFTNPRHLAQMQVKITLASRLASDEAVDLEAKKLGGVDAYR
jgi:hypothetical protein